MSKDTSPVLFLRPASGLTKYFGLWTSFLYVTGASLHPLAWTYLGSLQDTYRGMNAMLTWSVGMILTILFTIMIVLLSVAMPRSAGFYQINARGVSPQFGIMAMWRGSIAVVILKMAYFYTALLTLGTLFKYLGRIYGNAGLTSLGTSFSTQSPWVLALTAIGLQAIFTVVAYVGTMFRIEPIVLAGGSLFATIGMFLAIFVLATTSPASLPTQYDAVWGAGAYSQVQTVATNAGFTPPSFDLNNSFIAASWPIAIAWPYIIINYGGEVQDPAKNLVASQIGSAILTSVMFVVASALFQNVFGTFSTAYTVAAKTGNLTMSAGISPGLPGFTAVLASNPIIAAWIMLSPVVMSIAVTPGQMAWVSRGFFQTSMDRMAPSLFGRLSRFRTPTFPILYFFIASVPIAALYALGYSSFLGAVAGVFVLWAIELMFDSLAGIALPYLKKPLYNGSIRKQPVIAGIPLVALLGAMMLPMSLVMTLVIAQGTQFIPMVSMAVQYGFAALWFIAHAEYNKRKNIDVEEIYKSLTPE